MADDTALKKKVNELEQRAWDKAGIEARVKKLVTNGIPKKKLDPKELLANKEQILNRVQLRAEEYNYMLKNCARSTALALMEEFGQGNMEIIKALAPFPGIGGNGEICGAISGTLINFGLFFNSANPLDISNARKTMMISQEFMKAFKDKIGYWHCADILENVILGHRLNPGESQEAMATFAKEKGFEKCGLPPGIGARLAAEFIIKSVNT